MCALGRAKMRMLIQRLLLLKAKHCQKQRSKYDIGDKCAQIWLCKTSVLFSFVTAGGSYRIHSLNYYDYKCIINWEVFVKWPSLILGTIPGLPQMCWVNPQKRNCLIVVSVLVEIWMGHLPNISCAPVCARNSLVATATLSFCDNDSFERNVSSEFLSYFLFCIPDRNKNICNSSRRC
jgi:hypothetical protein